MKRTALFLALLLSLSLLCACAETPPPATTAPPQTIDVLESLPDGHIETCPASETTAPTESAPVLFCPGKESTEPLADYTEYKALLDFSANPNWLARAIGCVFERPEEVDLYYMFYLGVEHPGSWDDICEESRNALADQGFIQEMDLQIMPAEKLEEALQTTFGVGLDEVTIPEGWGYIEAEDAYCSNHSDAFFPGVPMILDVEGDGKDVYIRYTIDGYYNTATDEFLDTAELVLHLIRTEDGSFHAVSNLIQETDYASLSDQELINLFSTEEAMEIWNYSSSIHPLSDEGMEYLCSLSPAFAELYSRASYVESLARYATQRSQELYEDPALQGHALPLYALADYLCGGVEIPVFLQN